MTRIKVDFNNLARGGQVRASLRNADGDIVEGQLVEAFDPDEDLVFLATVTEIDEAKGRVYLSPQWEPTATFPTLATDFAFMWSASARGLMTHGFTNRGWGLHVDLTVAPPAGLPVRTPVNG
jgi:hypothetical protein